MIQLKFSQEIRKADSNIKVAVIAAKVSVHESSSELLQYIETLCQDIHNKVSIDQIASFDQILEGRNTYKNLGKSPSKYRLSSEALLRRVVQGKGLYRVNNVVDINNIISIQSKCPVGSYDLDKIDSNIILKRAEDGEKYKGIGKDLINIEHLPVFADSEGSFGSPTSDSERAMIKNSSKNIIMCIYSFCGTQDLDKHIENAKKLLAKYADGKNFEVKIY